jgi:hypothetical protein
MGSFSPFVLENVNVQWQSSICTVAIGYVSAKEKKKVPKIVCWVAWTVPQQSPSHPFTKIGGVNMIFTDDKEW